MCLPTCSCCITSSDTALMTSPLAHSRLIWKLGGCNSITEIILAMDSANEKRHYIVLPPLIGRARTQNAGWQRWHLVPGSLRKSQCCNSCQVIRPERCGRNFKSKICKLIIENSSRGTCREIAFRWMPQNFTIGEVNIGSGNCLVSSAISHNLGQC